VIAKILTTMAFVRIILVNWSRTRNWVAHRAHLCLTRPALSGRKQCSVSLHLFPRVGGQLCI